MTPLTIYQDSRYKTTAVSNYFIDEYMNDANATQIRIYLYLLRVMGEGLSTSVCEMADFFNFPNPSFFGKFVKGHIGMTPLQYRFSEEEN